ncbi:unnamed protein product [Camellia sinensis]
MGEGTFGQVLECLDNENLEHLAMMERLLGLPAEKYFKRSARLDWLDGASSKESTRAIWKLLRLQLHVDGWPPNVITRLTGLDGMPPQQPLHRQHKGFLETYRQWTASVSSQREGKPYEHRSNRKDSMAQQECKDGYDALETSKVERSSYQQKRLYTQSYLRHRWRSFNRSSWLTVDATNRILSKMGEGPFGQVWECFDNENLEHLAMMERLLGPLPQHMIISADLRAEKYFKRSARLDWLEGACSKESTRSQNCKFKCFSGILCCLLCIGSLLTQPSTPGVLAGLMVHVDGRPPNVIARLMGLDWLPSQQPLHRQHKGFLKTYRQWTASVSSQRDGKPYELRSNRKDLMAQQECKDEYEVLETSKVERSSYPAKRTINSKLSEAEMAFIQQKFMADHGTFGQVLECLDNENLEHLAMMERLLGPLPQHMIISAEQEWTFGQVLECLDNENLEHLAVMERLLGPLPQHMIISADLRAEQYFKRSARLDWLEGASSKESTRAVWKLTRLQSKCMFVTVHVDGRPPNVIAKLMGLNGLPSQQPLHRQHKGFSKTYRQWTASVLSQRDGKSYELRSKWKDSMAPQECKDEYEVLGTSKVERSSYPAKRTINSKLSEAEMAFIQQKFMVDHGTFGQVLECLDNEKLEHLAMMERCLRAEKYFKRTAHLDWPRGASSKGSTGAVLNLPRLQSKLMRLDGLPPQQPLHRQHKGFSETYRQWTAPVSSQRDGKPYEHRSNRKDLMFMADHDRILSKMGEGTFGPSC